VDVVTVTDKRALITAFFSSIFGAQSGLFCLAYMKPGRRGSWKEEFFQYPEEADSITARTLELSIGHNVYFSPMLYSARSREKQNVLVTPVLYSDLDECDPEQLLVEPTWSIESSPGRFQAYWVLQEPIDPDDAEDLSRRIAYKHAEQGADRSGWDLSQVLRVPGTNNFKYNAADEVPLVKVVNIARKIYRPEDFDEHYPPVTGYEYVDEDMPDLAALPDGLAIMERRRLEISPIIWALYNDEPEKDWSKPLWNLEMRLFELGFTKEEVFAITATAKCNKYERDGRQIRLLWKEVCRAASRHESNEIELIGGANAEGASKVPLLSPEERQAVLQTPPTFIERYIEWARSLGDAAPQYHQAGAFVALSSILAGRVRLPTSFGTLIPNLWFMILADTTLTRKTTAMDISIDMVTDIDPDAILATDGSIEGLLTAMAGRPSRPSVFLRDEFTGLLEQMTKKDYMAGTAELLTKLYDGKYQKRVLKKETIEVREPVLIVFAGGIKDKTTSLLTHEQVSSGFMPRFIFITAESDITRLKPLGPPSQQTINTGAAIKNELTDIFSFYARKTEMTVKSLKANTNNVDMKFMAKLTDEAWIRYNELETQMLQAGLESKNPAIMTPTYDRLSKSILKAAVLLAAARREEEPTVTLQDMLRSIYYAENWKTYSEEIMDSIGSSQAERKLEKIHKYIYEHPGASRSMVMQNYHLDSREATITFDTLEQRGLIIKRMSGRSQLFYPIGK
jgi:hypothetical protein